MLVVMMAILKKTNLVVNINILSTLSFVQLYKSKSSAAFLDFTVRSNK